MNRFLFLPFLSIASGHHQAADALISHMMTIAPSACYRKVDLLRYGFGFMESVVSQFYLKWIHLFPKSYSWLYRMSVAKPRSSVNRFPTYDLLFEKSILKLIRGEKPELIFCTHALPSYLLNQLKRRKCVSVPVVNVYTDFFINNLWGMDHIDWHFVPAPCLKKFLIDKGVPNSRIFITGIPVHPLITACKKENGAPPYTVMIAAGSLGVGTLRALIQRIGYTDQIRYLVLCGKNRDLRAWLETRNCPNIIPLPYINSREKMNELYNKADAILTKPGGITISESLKKRIPILVYNALPGQEQMNLDMLKRHGLIMDLEQRHATSSLEQEILQLLNSDEILLELKTNMDHYVKNLEQHDISLLLEQLIHD